MRDLRPVVRIPLGVVGYGPPEIVPLPLDVHEELIQVPDVSQPSLPTPEILGVLGSELVTPLPDGLVGDHHSA